MKDELFRIIEAAGLIKPEVETGFFWDEHPSNPYFVKARCSYWLPGKAEEVKIGVMAEAASMQDAEKEAACVEAVLRYICKAYALSCPKGPTAAEVAEGAIFPYLR